MRSIRARMLSGSISNSAKLSALSCDGARLLFTWMIPHADNLGRLRGEPIQVKAAVMPRNPASVDKIETWLTELAKSGLIYWYQHQGQRFIFIEKWMSYQKLWGNMSNCSMLPNPENSECTPYVQRSNGVCTAYVQRIKNVPPEGEGEGEGEGERTPLSPAAPLTGWRRKFDAFWQAYPHVKGRSRRRMAEKAWMKLTPSEGLFSAIMAGLEAARSFPDWTKDGGAFVPGAQVWINQAGWDTGPAREINTSPYGSLASTTGNEMP